MQKRDLIIIGANEFQQPLVEKARHLGYKTHVFAWEEGAVCKEIADQFYNISITEKDKILEQAKRINPLGIASIGSDLAVITVNYISNSLGLTANSMHSTEISTDKYKMRKALHENNLPCPRFVIADDDNNLEKTSNMRFPLIIKPVDRSGSRGVTLVCDKDEENLNPAIRYAREQSFINQAIMEEYIEGQEYSMEMLSYKGEHHFLAITEKFTTGAPNFVETMHLQPGRIEPDILEKAIKIMMQALDALCIECGASHAEFKVDDHGNIMIIEIGARMGGDYIGSHMVPFSTGFDYIRMVIDIAVGKEITVNKKERLNQAVLVKFIFNREDIDNYEAIKNEFPESLAYSSNIDEIDLNCNALINDSSKRLGFYIVQGKELADCLTLVKD